MKVVAAALVADTLRLYSAAAAEDAEVTCQVVETVAPGANVKMADAKVLFQPAGTEARRLKLPVLHTELSLFVTATV